MYVCMYERATPSTGTPSVRTVDGGSPAPTIWSVVLGHGNFKPSIAAEKGDITLLHYTDILAMWCREISPSIYFCSFSCAIYV